METVEIKRATPNDIEQLQEIGRQTFYETFAESNSASDMKQYLDNNFGTEQVRSELTNPGSRFYIARLNQKAIGYLKINTSKAQTELQNSQSLEIERIYVLSSYHGKKVGQLLYDKALEVAKLENITSIWLGVWEENPRAIRFYEKNGFVAFDKHIFKLGDDEQTDIMMKKHLAS